MTTLTFRTNAQEVAGGLPASDLPCDLPQMLDVDPAVVAGSAAEEIAHVLFDRDRRGEIHRPWRSLISRPEFRSPPGLSFTERTALSYARLRLVNDSLDDPGSLVADPYRLAGLHEWTGVVDASLGAVAGIHYNLFLGSLYDHEGPSSRSLSDFTSMQRTGTFLCTELEHGNDAACLRTTAAYDRSTGGFVLHTPTPGAQKFMPNTSLTGGPKTALVAARLLVDGEDQGVFLFLTPLTDESGPLPGVRVRRLPERAGHPLDHCITSFDQVRLPREALLEAEHGRLDADGTVTSSLGNRRKRFLRSVHRVTTGKLCMSGAAVGVSRAALAIAVRYAHARHIGGPKAGQRIPLAAHRSHHGRLLLGLSTAYAMTFLHREAVTRWAERGPGDSSDTERMVALTKSWTTWQARDIAIECRERCGAAGLLSASALAGIATDLEGTITAEGDNLVISLKAAAELLFNHQAPVRRTDRPVEEQSLSDVYFLRDLLAEAEVLWHARARRSLREGPSRDSVRRWNAASASALKMAEVHTRLLAGDAFIDAAAQAVGPEARHLLHQLARLFLLKEVAEHTGILLATGQLTVEHIRDLPDAIEETIADLAPHMMTLVDAFDLPEEFFAGIPIAHQDYALRWDELAGPPEGFTLSR
ncbi:acyl-CoA oxidase [Streptomyces solincola]|uniref:Acyl-CoA oxidase n=2 Tax=Streptomyces solincola TaxID=2100817 RepID=A0A2S9PUI3_9ACTN|nr:acyl-CoA oxidase [Streptomyces solincola]